MKYFKCDRFIQIRKIENNKAKNVPSDWYEVQENGEPLKEEAKKEPKKETKKTNETKKTK